ncbi:MAG: hypothetical protein NAOJABEB_02980 [Steroidobacteraceae bacterium]|nr:hypothetical protein [Steroidobacteraceae bacterium]
MQRWEYQVIVRARTVLVRAPASLSRDVVNKELSDWQPDSENMLATLADMGASGWELVSVYPRSSTHPSPVTTEEVWIFKRPRE